MGLNRDPIYAKNGAWGFVAVTAANVSSQGNGTVGTDIFLLDSADATNGTWVEEVICMPTASAANTLTTATVARLFIGTVGSGATTSANTHLIAEIVLPQVTAANSAGANFPIYFPIQKWLPPGSFLLVTNHAAPAASTAWKFSSNGGDG